MQHQDVMAFRKTGKWQKQLFDHDLSNDQLHYITETLLLASRVRDDEARGLADRLRERASAVSFSANEEEAESRMRAAGDTQQSLIHRLGQLVREMDETN